MTPANNKFIGRSFFILQYTMKRKLLIIDFRTLLNNLKQIYPETFRVVIKHGLISISIVSLIFYTFFFDDFIRVFLLQIHNTTLDYIFSFGHWYGNGNPTIILFLIFYLGGIYSLNEHLRDTGLLICESFLFTGLITLIMKSALGRWRPFTGAEPFDFYWLTFGPNEHLSMPSGHATVAFALSSVLAGTTDNNILKFAYYILAVITAISRIYHDQHWFSDVLASAVIGITIGNILIQKHKNKKLHH